VTESGPLGEVADEKRIETLKRADLAAKDYETRSECFN
jgi:hypothetical protein